MGFWSSLVNTINGVTKERKLLVVGLDNSGKTTILRKIKPKKMDLTQVVPTIGCAVEEFYRNSIKFTCYDMSGQSKFRQLWETYIKEVDAIIYVIDAIDSARFGVAQQEFRMLMESAQIRHSSIPILVFANKMDVPGAANPMDCADVLQLNQINDRAWNIMASCALTGEGLLEGLTWIAERVR